jgi:hypothetical protein
MDTCAGTAHARSTRLPPSRVYKHTPFWAGALLCRLKQPQVQVANLKLNSTQTHKMTVINEINTKYN